MAMRLILFVLSACFAVAAAGSGIDRLSAYSPQLAAQVPDGFAEQALIMRGDRALRSNSPAAALKLGEALVDRAPVEASSTAVLGAARLAGGDDTGAEAAFRVAGLFGWREKLTQIYWMQSALALGDYRVASQRLDAVLRQNPAMLADRRLLDPMEHNAEARAAFVDRMAENPGWLVNYAHDTEGVSSKVMQTRSYLLLQLAARGQQMGCNMIAPSVRKLVQFGAAIQAQQLWRAHCPQAGTAEIADGSFAVMKIDPPIVPFAWSLPGDGQVDVAIAGGLSDHNRTLSIASAAAVRRPFIMQLLAVPPGSYLLHWKAKDSAGNATDRISAMVSCSADSRDWLNGMPDGAAGSWTASIAIDGGCEGHWLIFAVAPGSDRVSFSDVTLMPDTNLQ